MSNKQTKLGNDSKQDFVLIKKYEDIKEYRLKNGLTVLYKEIKGTGVVTTNITYNVGARNENIGETGVAHMLEHMLFKPTKQDLQKKIDSGAMQFERETGCILNANTWKDRTTYFFCYPKEHFTRALTIEAERMHDVIISDSEFQPERGNVLSEFDMYFGDPQFALSVAMVSTAYHAHPYGHETIGYREDIERYTTEKLKAFYNKFYDPQNATLMIIGDVREKEALTEAARVMGTLKTNGVQILPPEVGEPKQEGLRRIEIERNAISNVVALGVKHGGFPDKEWFTTMLLFAILTDGPDSILYKKLVDTGLSPKIDTVLEPTSDENLGIIFVTLSKKATHEQIEKIVLDTVASITPKEITLAYKKIKEKIITAELIGRESSLKIAMELTEYVSARKWETYFDTVKMIESINTKDIVDESRKLFDRRQMTIGRFIGKQ
jgi:zinc protease